MNFRRSLLILLASLVVGLVSYSWRKDSRPFSIEKEHAINNLSFVTTFKGFGSGKVLSFSQRKKTSNDVSFRRFQPLGSTDTIFKDNFFTFKQEDSPFLSELSDAPLITQPSFKSYKQTPPRGFVYDDNEGGEPQTVTFFERPFQQLLPQKLENWPVVGSQRRSRAQVGSRITSSEEEIVSVLSQAGSEERQELESQFQEAFRSVREENVVGKKIELRGEEPKRQEEGAAARLEAERRQREQATEEAAQLLKRQKEAADRLKAEEEVAKQKRQKEVARLEAEAEKLRRAAEQKRRAEAVVKLEAERKRQKEAAAMLKAEEEARRKAEVAEAERKRKEAEAERGRRAAEQKRQEEEKQRELEEERQAEAAVKLEAERKRQEELAAAKKKAEAGAAAKLEAERLAAEAERLAREVRLKAEERLKEMEAARLKAEEEARRKAEVAELERKRKEEAEAARVEAERRQREQATEEAAQLLKRQKEAAARLKVEDETRRKAEAEAELERKRRAEAEAAKVEAEKLRRAAERKRQEELAAAKKTAEAEAAERKRQEEEKQRELEEDAERLATERLAEEARIKAEQEQLKKETAVRIEAVLKQREEAAAEAVELVESQIPEVQRSETLYMPFYEATEDKTPEWPDPAETIVEAGGVGQKREAETAASLEAEIKAGIAAAGMKAEEEAVEEEQNRNAEKEKARRQEILNNTLETCPWLLPPEEIVGYPLADQSFFVYGRRVLSLERFVGFVSSPVSRTVPEVRDDIRKLLSRIRVKQENFENALQNLYKEIDAFEGRIDKIERRKPLRLQQIRELRGQNDEIDAFIVELQYYIQAQCKQIRTCLKEGREGIRQAEESCKQSCYEREMDLGKLKERLDEQTRELTLSESKAKEEEEEISAIRKTMQPLLEEFRKIFDALRSMIVDHLTSRIEMRPHFASQSDDQVVPSLQAFRPQKESLLTLPSAKLQAVGFTLPQDLGKEDCFYEPVGSYLLDALSGKVVFQAFLDCLQLEDSSSVLKEHIGFLLPLKKQIEEMGESLERHKVTLLNLRGKISRSEVPVKKTEASYDEEQEEFFVILRSTYITLNELGEKKSNLMRRLAAVKSWSTLGVIAEGNLNQIPLHEKEKRTIRGLLKDMNDNRKEKERNDLEISGKKEALDRLEKEKTSFQQKADETYRRVDWLREEGDKTIGPLEEELEKKKKFKQELEQILSGLGSLLPRIEGVKRLSEQSTMVDDEDFHSIFCREFDKLEEEFSPSGKLSSLSGLYDQWKLRSEMKDPAECKSFARPLATSFFPEEIDVF